MSISAAARLLVVLGAFSSATGCAARQKLPRLLGEHAIYIARHGQTAWNRVHRFQGDPDLDQIGYLNRISLWMLLRDTPLSAVFTSALRRTQRTAELVARQHRLAIRPRAALDEIHAGVLAGVCVAYMVGAVRHHAAELAECKVAARGSRPALAIAEVRRIWRKYALSKGLDARVPLGESWRDVQRRIAVFVRRELRPALASGNVLVVGHGLSNRVLLQLLLNWSLEAAKPLRGQRNDQVFRITGLGGAEPTLALYTPGVGWRTCGAPTVGQRLLDCFPRSVDPKRRPEPRTPSTNPATH